MPPDSQPYRTLAVPGSAETIVKKSRFLGQAMPVQSPEEAAALVAQTRTKHWDASHHVWAYALRGGWRTRCADDGEPQGTAGLPTLEVLQKEDLVDCVVVTTRWFGGTLLGAGGLARAYAQAAKRAVEAAGIITMQPCAVLRVQCGYDVYYRLQNLLPTHAVTVLVSDFGAEISLELRLPTPAMPAFRAALTQAAAGRVKITHLREEFAEG
jgi:uncharacterized YigZ family protein